MSVTLLPGVPALDTLAQLPTNTSQAKTKKTLEKRARSKYVTTAVATPLSKLRSPLEKSYRASLSCASQLTEARGKISGIYCGQRWCLVCARIRTAKLLKGYMPALQEMEDKYFLTLTVPNCCANALKSTIVSMHKEATNINRVLKERRKIKYSSLRKLECTYNAERNDYHPHFHFIFDSEYAAELFLEQWLMRFPNATRSAQDLRQADNESCFELFKYFTKIISKTKKSDSYTIQVQALDIMFRAMKGRRTFQACGIIKQIDEEIEPEQALLTYADQDVIIGWSWRNSDWIDMETGELLTCYEPSESILKITTNIVQPKQKKSNFGAIPTPTPKFDFNNVTSYHPKRYCQPARSILRYRQA